MPCNDVLMALLRRWKAGLTGAAFLLLAACGGGGGGSSPTLVGGTTPTTADNVQAVKVTTSPDGSGVNLLMTSVTICTSGTSNCQTIDHILVDTGSFGLRVMSSVLNGTVSPIPVLSTHTGNHPLLECAQFADGYTWGPVARVDVKIGGETASNIPVEIIGDAAHQTVPTACSSTGTDASTVAAFGANGVLGIGVFKEDCGQGCNVLASNGLYYDCLDSACTSASSVTVPLLDQVRNPIAGFTTDNNGVVIQLPAVPDGGSSTVSGSMIFGIGTQSNNALGSARVLAVNPNNGTFITQAPTPAGGTENFSYSFADTGSNGLFFPTGSTNNDAFQTSVLRVCASTSHAPGFFCPDSTQYYQAVIADYLSANGVASAFSIANADTLATSGNLAFVNIGAPIPTTLTNSSQIFDWGLPFYYGKTVYTALEGASTPGGTGPYVAF